MPLLPTAAPQLAVIIPIYNVEEYLSECLESVEKQSIFDSLEVLLVDDGSTDGSAEIARKFANSHANVQLLQKPNGGLGSARNHGMRHVKAPYVSFLDSDDRFRPETCEDLIQFFDDPEVHVTIGRLETFPKPSNYMWSRYFDKGTRREQGINEIPDMIHGTSACNKAFRMETVRALALEFREGVHFEDAYFVIPMLLNSPLIGMANKLVYDYRKRDSGGSIMDSLFTRAGNYWDYLALIEFLDKLKEDIPNSQRLIVDNYIARGFQGFLMRGHEVFDGEELQEFYKKAHEVIVSVDQEAIRRSTHNMTHRLPYANLLEKFQTNDTLPVSEVGAVSLVGRSPYVGYIPNGVANVLRRGSKGAQVRIESIQPLVDSSSVRLEGRVSFRGIRLETQPSIRLNVNAGGRTHVVDWKQRIDKRASDGIWCGFSVDIPASLWNAGERRLLFSLTSEKGEIRTRAVKTASFFRNSRPFYLEGKAFDFRVNDSHQVLITVSKSKKRNRYRTVLHQAYSDWKSYRKREPFSGLKLVRTLTKPFMKHPIWVIGERWDIAQDNGAALFKHVASAQDVRSYYVVDRESEAYQRMKRVGRVVAHGSYLHKFLLLHARAHINAFDVDTYTIPRDWDKAKYIQHLLPRIGAKRVFLQHGVTWREESKGLHRLVQGYDMLSTVSDAEEAYFATDLAYGTKAVNTGFPRFDSLERIPGEKNILFAPTWRSYLVKASYSTGGASSTTLDLEQTDYYKRILGLIRNEKLRAELTAHGFKIHFLPHYEMADVMGETWNDDPLVEVLDQRKVSFQECLKKSNIFVTDYSSTMFDIALMGIPTVHYAFDNEEFWNRHATKSYFDFENDSFGPVAYDEETAVDNIIAYLRNGAVREQKFTDRVEEFFKFNDRKNSERMANAIRSITG